MIPLIRYDIDPQNGVHILHASINDGVKGGGIVVTGHDLMEAKTKFLTASNYLKPYTHNHEYIYMNGNKVLEVDLLSAIEKEVNIISLPR